MTPDRIAALIDFLQLADRLKHVERRGQTVGPDGAARQENSAEHCWNVALVAILLHAEMQDAPDLGHVLAMIAAHDLVEVEAGDTFAYDQAHILTQAARERAAADVVFGRLPPDLGQKLRGLWEEFEAGRRRKRASPWPATARRASSRVSSGPAIGRPMASRKRRRRAG